MHTRERDEEGTPSRLDWSVWRRLLGYSLRKKGELALFALAGSVVAAVDIGFPLVTRDVIDRLSAGEAVDFGRASAAYGVLTLLLMVGVRAFVHLGGRVRTRVSHDIRRDAFSNLQDLSFTFYDRRPVGWLMARMTSDCERLSNIMAWGVLDLVWGTTLMGGIALVLFSLDAQLAAITLAVIPALAWISLMFQRRILASSRVVRATNSRLTATYNEGIAGARTTKVFTREDENFSEFSSLAGEMFSASVRNQLQSALYLPIVLALGGLATGLALAFGGFRVLDPAAGLSLGTLVLFLTLGGHFFQPVRELAHWFCEMQMAQASAERVLGLVDEVPEIADTPMVRERIWRRRHGVAQGLAPDGYPDRVGRIEFERVSFSYAPTHAGGRRVPVLHELDLTVEPGQTIALVGPTGGGKSTIVSLLSRFYEPTSGRILIDGMDLRERSLAWFQSRLGIVLQTPHLFGGSVRENIRYGRLEASDAEVEEAARIAGAHDFALALAGGYDFHVGEDGNRLSVGQKQLVSFARAILADPALLVMDEATSSVDTETERRIQRGLARVLSGRTSFVIAHRLSTIRGADRILVIDAGRIVESGTHAELFARHGRYHELYTGQAVQEASRPGSWRSTPVSAG